SSCRSRSCTCASRSRPTFSGRGCVWSGRCISFFDHEDARACPEFHGFCADTARAPTFTCHPERSEGAAVLASCLQLPRCARDDTIQYMRELLLSAAERAAAYLEGLETRAVAPDPVAVAGLSRFDVPLADEPANPETILRELD